MVGYILIAFEQKIRVNKAATALILAVASWWLILFESRHHDIRVVEQLSGHLADISQILFFLIGAMTIVEVIDSHHGFRFIKKFIRTKNARSLNMDCIGNHLFSLFVSRQCHHPRHAQAGIYVRAVHDLAAGSGALQKKF